MTMTSKTNLCSNENNICHSEIDLALEKTGGKIVAEILSCKSLTEEIGAILSKRSATTTTAVPKEKNVSAADTETENETETETDLLLAQLLAKHGIPMTHENKILNLYVIRNLKNLRRRPKEIVSFDCCTTTEMYCLNNKGLKQARLQANYLLFYSFQKQSTFLSLCTFIDLSTVSHYSINSKDMQDRGWQFKIQLFDFNRGSNELYFRSQESLFVRYLLITLDYNQAVLLANNEKPAPGAPKVKRNYLEIDEHILYADHVFVIEIENAHHENENENKNDNEPTFENCACVLYYAVLRDLRLEFYQDYASFLYQQTPIKYYTISDENEQKENDDEQNGGKFSVFNNVSAVDLNDDHFYALQLIFSDPDSSSNSNSNSDIGIESGDRILLLSLYNNVRHEFLTHLQFLTTFHIMPYQIRINCNRNKLQQQLLKAQIANMIGIAVDDNDISSSSKDIYSKLMLVNNIYYQWCINSDKKMMNGLGLSELCAMFGIELKMMVHWYKTANENVTINNNNMQVKVSVCGLGAECPLFEHYIRNRNAERNKRECEIAQLTLHSKQEFASRMFASTIEDIYAQQLDKIHILLFQHYAESATATATEVKETKDTNNNSNSNGTTSETGGRQPRTQQTQTLLLSKNMNVNKFIIQVNDTTAVNATNTTVTTAIDDTLPPIKSSKRKPRTDSNKFVAVLEAVTAATRKLNRNSPKSKDSPAPAPAPASASVSSPINIHYKFGFGESVKYWSYDKHDANFVLAANNSLYAEICANRYLRMNLSGMQFWCLYLECLLVHRAFHWHLFFALDMGLNNFWSNVQNASMMSINHYLSLVLYSNETQLQYEYKKYARKLNENEQLSEFYLRNSYIAHWNRYLIESVKFFGYTFAANQVVYCGISAPLFFNSFEHQIYSPLSTTTSPEIAFQFAGPNGIVLKLERNNIHANYFPLYLFSEFPHEKEWFICDSKVKIVDIGFRNQAEVETEKKKKNNKKSEKITYCKKYLLAIRLLEKILMGELFVDVASNRKLIATKNVRLLIQMLDCFRRRTVIHLDKIERLNQEFLQTQTQTQNKTKNVAGYQNAVKFLKYNQNLFNNLLLHYINPNPNPNPNQTEMKDDDDLYGDRQLWINKSELTKLSNLYQTKFELKQIRENYILKLSAKLHYLLNEKKAATHYTPETISFTLEKERYGEFLELKESQLISIAANNSGSNADSNGCHKNRNTFLVWNKFEFEVKLMLSSSSFPRNSCLFLYYLGRKTKFHFNNVNANKNKSKNMNTDSICVSYDILCPELDFQKVNSFKKFEVRRRAVSDAITSVDYSSPPIFSNVHLESLNMLNIQLAIRIVHQ